MAQETEGTSSVSVIRWPSELSIPPVTPDAVELIERLVSDAGVRLALDMSGVTEDDLNATLNANLVRLWRAARDGGGALRIFSAPPYLTRVFEIIGLEEVFRNYAGVEEAIRSFEE